ncbi:MAG: L-2-amino-thiazoline-4-carboxylic acid hydrolase [Myxococcota bacterium]
MPDEGAEPGSVQAAIERGERAAASITVRRLRRELGLWRTARVLARVAVGRARGAPFAELPPPDDERDRLSRRQCGPAVLLYRALLRETTQPHALQLTRASIQAGALPFLERMIPPLSLERFAVEGPALAQRFFNAEGEARMIDERTMGFDVRRCRFVELLEAAGAAELSPLMCEVDGEFFDGQRRPVTLRRRHTLAAGHDRCDFRFVAHGNDDAGRGGVG